MRKIFTHAGIFHCDDVMGVAILKLLYPSMPVCRSYDLGGIQEGDVVIDTGGEYNPTKFRYDHHHDGQLPAACVLVWRTFGSSCVYAEMGPTDLAQRNLLSVMLDRVEEGLLTAISDIDVGKKIADVDDFNSIIRSFNDMTDGFEMAVNICQQVLRATINRTYHEMLDEVRYFSDTRKRKGYRIHNDPKGLRNWQKLAEQEGTMFMINPNARGGFQIVSRDSKLFPIPKEEGQVFLHNSGFLATYPSEHQCVQMAQRLVRLYQQGEDTDLQEAVSEESQ